MKPYPCFRPLLLVALVLFGSALQADQKTGTLDIHWIDSEGGGSTLIVTPAGESVLIDAGNPGGRDPARIIAAVKAAGLTRIDWFVLTHFHTDHFGGAAEVAAEVPLGGIWSRDIPEGDPDGRTPSQFPLVIKPFRSITAPRHALRPGAVIPLRSVAGGPKLELRCLAADQKFADAPGAPTKPLAGSVPSKETDTSDNANSAVFLLSFGDFRFFDGGDLTWNLEEKLVAPLNRVGRVDVYQTNHHGLAVSNNPILVRSLEPTVVVMNNGPQKGGEAGSFAAIRSARSVQALYQIHRSFKSESDNAPREFIANEGNRVGAEAAQCPAHRIQLSVAADGRSYAVSVPATGHSATYPTLRR
jgi:hypothetical protein